MTCDQDLFLHWSILRGKLRLGHTLIRSLRCPQALEANQILLSSFDLVNRNPAHRLSASLAFVTIS
jgi:hypothetical protein